MLNLEQYNVQRIDFEKCGHDKTPSPLIRKVKFQENCVRLPDVLVKTATDQGIQLELERTSCEAFDILYIQNGFLFKQISAFFNF